MVHHVLQMFKDEESVQFLKDPVVTKKFSDSKTLSDVNPKEYDTVFYPGGEVQIPQSWFDPFSVDISLQGMDRSSISRRILKTRRSFQL